MAAIRIFDKISKLLDAVISGSPSGKFLKHNGTKWADSAISAGDVPTLNQDTTGTAAHVTTNANLTGDVTSVGNATTLASIPAIAGTNLTGTAANLTAGHVTTNANLTGDVTSSGNATTLASIPAIAGTNLTGTAANLTAGHVTTNANLTGDVTSSGNATTLANIPAIAGTNLTGTANSFTAGDVTRNHAIYAAASPPTVDVGMFTVVKTSVNLKAAGTTAGFTVPSGRTFVCTGAYAVVTAVTTPGAGTQTFQIKESGASGQMTPGAASASATPAVGNYYASPVTSAQGPYFVCAAGNIANIVVATSHAGSTVVTGSVFITGYYSA
jgi:hypothetical protein